MNPDAFSAPPPEARQVFIGYRYVSTQPSWETIQQRYNDKRNLQMSITSHPTQSLNLLESSAKLKNSSISIIPGPHLLLFLSTHMHHHCLFTHESKATQAPRFHSSTPDMHLQDTNLKGKAVKAGGCCTLSLALADSALGIHSCWECDEFSSRYCMYKVHTIGDLPVVIWILSSLKLSRIFLCTS